MNNNEYRVGVNRGLPVGMGYFSVSFGFGAMAVSQGLKTLDAVLISATNLTSAGQFAGLTLIVAAATLWEMVLTQLVINSRYALMSLALSQRMGEKIGLLPRLLIAFFNTDEIFALAMAREAPLTVPFLLGLGTLPFIGWTLGTLCGVLSVAVLAGGVVLFGNYQKMREMESVLVSVLPDGVRGTADGKEAVTVEQLRGSVTPLESGEAGVDVDADGTTAKNGGQVHKWTLESAADGDTEGTAIAGRQNGQASGGQSEEDGKMAETKAPYILPEPEAQRDLPNPGGNSTAGQDYPVTNLKPGGTYTVGDGETLYGICFKLYGNIRHLDDILAVNHLTDENRIIAGQTLVLPDVSGE